MKLKTINKLKENQMNTSIKLTNENINLLKEMAIRASLEEVVYQKDLNIDDFVDRGEFYELIGVSNWYLFKLEVDDCDVTENDFLVYLFGEDASFFSDLYANDFQ